MRVLAAHGKSYASYSAAVVSPPFLNTVKIWYVEKNIISPLFACVSASGASVRSSISTRAADLPFH